MRDLRMSVQSSQAVDKAMDFLSTFMSVAGGLSLSSVVEMLVSLVLTVRVVTVPIVMRSVEQKTLMKTYCTVPRARSACRFSLISEGTLLSLVLRSLLVEHHYYVS